MTIAGLKIVTWGLGVAGGVIIASVDPTTKGYIIAGCVVAIPNIIKGIFDYVMQSRTLVRVVAVHEVTEKIKEDMTEVKRSVNGVKDDLVRAVKKEAFAAGEKKERDDPHVSQEKP